MAGPFNITPIMLLLIAVMAVVIWRQQDSNMTLSKQVDTLNTDVKKAQAVISNQATTSRIFNTLTEVNAHDNRQTSTRNAATRTEIRTIIKTAPCATQYLPDSVAGRLFDLTHRLRAIALSGTAAQPDRTDTGPAAARRLTYAQAVEWLPMLLDVLEQANNNLTAIRAAEQARQQSAGIEHSQ